MPPTPALRSPLPAALTSGRAPSSTYRVQLRTPASDPDGGGLTLRDVADAVPRLAELGVGAVYLSPVLRATHGSTHGYDVVDPTAVSDELGGPEALRALRTRCREYGLGLVVDIVPNHLGVADARQNPWWWSVLRLGADSPHVDAFDVDLSPDNGADGRIAIPVLGSHEDLDALELDRSGAEPVLCYYDNRYPVAPGTDSGTPRQVHERQHYRLVHWREPLLGYRRFFTVTELAGLRQEDRRVFDASHAEVRRWVAEDLVDGIRVDHPDGLTDPVGYCRWLRELAGDERWLLVEKILAPDEVPDPALGVEGTTGYDALRLIDQVLTDPSGRDRLTELSRLYTGGAGDEEQVHAESARLKREVVTGDLVPELRRLVRAVRADAGAPTGGDEPAGPDDAAVTEVLLRLIATTPVYRADYPVLRGTLPALLDRIVADSPELGRAARCVAGALARGGAASARTAQVTGAATAKAEEDRLFYRLARLVSLNEVGGSPGRFGESVAAFHQAMGERARFAPASMTALSTHDTKRGEDVRARIGVLSQVPDRWAALVSELFAECPPPATDAGYFLLQNVVGVWPADGAMTDDVRRRLHDYTEKAIREAAVHTTWTDPEAGFEDSIHSWLDAVCADPRGLMSDLVAVVAAPGRENALAAKALQLLGPGVPDVYQGTEIWEDSLVDPDNRRPVDADAVAEARRSGHPKYDLVRTALHLRRRHPTDLAAGAYLPLPTEGPAGDAVLGFARELAGEPGVCVVVRRRTAVVAADELAGTGVVLPAGRWRLASTDGRPGPGPEHPAGPVDARELLGGSPVAILVRAD